MRPGSDAAVRSQKVRSERCSRRRRGDGLSGGPRTALAEQAGLFGGGRKLASLRPLAAILKRPTRPRGHSPRPRAVGGRCGRIRLGS
jgi:hypothetical protein